MLADTSVHFLERVLNLKKPDDQRNLKLVMMIVFLKVPLSPSETNAYFEQVAEKLHSHRSARLVIMNQ